MLQWWHELVSTGQQGGAHGTSGRTESKEKKVVLKFPLSSFLFWDNIHIGLTWLFYQPTSLPFILTCYWLNQFKFHFHLQSTIISSRSARKEYFFFFKTTINNYWQQKTSKNLASLLFFAGPHLYALCSLHSGCQQQALKLHVATF